jgi:hypothetical protein
VTRRVFPRRPGLWIAALLAALFLQPGIAPGETLKVGTPNQVLYPDPDFAGTPLGPVPLGSEVDSLLARGDWFKVSYQDRKGWMNRSAFPQLKKLPGNLPGLLSGEGVKPGGYDEVALGGKAERMPSKELIEMEDRRMILKRNQPLYPDPDPAGNPIGSVPAGEKVLVKTEAGDWCKVQFNNQLGWLPKEALNFR